MCITRDTKTETWIATITITWHANIIFYIKQTNSTKLTSLFWVFFLFFKLPISNCLHFKWSRRHRCVCKIQPHSSNLSFRLVPVVCTNQRGVEYGPKLFNSNPVRASPSPDQHSVWRDWKWFLFFTASTGKSVLSEFSPFKRLNAICPCASWKAVKWFSLWSEAKDACSLSHWWLALMISSWAA